MAITIRPARTSDAAALPDVERDAGRSFLALPDLSWVSRDTVISPEEHLPAIEAGTAWVAVDEGGIVGFLTAEAVGSTLHIWEMAVLREAQQRGIGARLIAVAAAHARTKGLAALTLTTFRDVAWNAPFYARNGFRIVEGADLDERLAELLAAEVEAGLPGDRRCAMRRSVVRL